MRSSRSRAKTRNYKQYDLGREIQRSHYSNDTFTHKNSYSYPNKRSTRKRSKKSNAPRIIVVLVSILILAGIFDTILNFHRIRPNVYIGDYQLGIMKKSTATDLLDAEFAKAYGRELRVKYKDKTWTTDADTVGLSYDTDALVESAYRVGREGSVFKKMRTRFLSYFKNTQLELEPDFDQKLSSRFISKIQIKTDRPAKESKVTLKDESFFVNAGKEGQLLSVEKLKSSMSKSLLRGEELIEAPVEVDLFEISEQEASEAADFANKLIDTQPTIKNGQSSTRIKPSQFATLLAFRKSDSKNSVRFENFDFTPKSAKGRYLKPAIRVSRLESEVVNSLKPVVEQKPTPATFDVHQGKVEIVPERAGRGHSATELARDIKKANLSTGKTFELKIGEIWPKRTTDVVKRYGIKEQISTFTIDYSKADNKSATNIKLSADYLDGYLLAPGKTFSFNEALEKRTFERGFIEAPAIVGGKLVDDLGGGICLTSSTIFNTALLAGLPITDRINHSFKLPSYPDGQDAAVSWGAPDLKFKNNEANWILIDSNYSNNALTISFYGTDQDYEIDLDVGEWKNRTNYTTQTIQVDGLGQGETKLLQEGAQGGNIVVTRTIKKDGKVMSVNEFRSHYKPRPEVIGIAP